LSVVCFGEQLGDVAHLRGMVIMHQVDDFEYQEDVVSLAMNTGADGVGDATGIGREACQRLEKQYGEFRFKGLVFTSASKQELLLQLRDRMQSVRVRIPRDEELRYDVHGLGKMKVGVAERLRVVTLQNALDKRSHADRATALAMMVDAGITAEGPAEGESVRTGASSHDLDVGEAPNSGYERPDHSGDYAGAAVGEREDW